MATGLAPLPFHPGSGGVAAATPVVAQVAAAGDGSVSLASGGRRIRARRAASCVLEPAPGDTVLAIGVEADAGAFVIAILDRPAGAEAVLSVPGAAETALVQDRLALRCERLTVDAGDATLRGRVARVAGGVLAAVAERIDVVARTLRRSADHELSRAGNATRTVDGAETVTAGEMMIEARTALGQRAGIVLVDAREDVRMNGERITMG